MLDPITCYEILDSASTERFADHLLSQARAFDGVDEIFGYRITVQQRIQPIISASYKMGVAERVQAYCEEFAAQDPILPKISHHIHFIQTQIGDIATQRYRLQCFDTPGFHEKISFSTAMAQEYLVISFYRSSRAKLKSLADWQVFGQVTLAALLRHHHHTQTSCAGRADSFWMQRALRLHPALSHSTLQQLQERLGISYPHLSAREQACTALSLLGLSIPDIAEILEVAESTATTFRKRACAKYGYDRYQSFIVGIVAQDGPMRKSLSTAHSLRT